jgi:hypothetical protein
MPCFCPGYTIWHSGGSNEIEDVPVFPFGLFLLLCGSPRESANGNIRFSNEEDEAREALTDRTVSRWQQYRFKR